MKTASIFLNALIVMQALNLPLLWHFIERPKPQEPFVVEYRVEGCQTPDDINVAPLRLSEVEGMLQ